jgi:transglutaminase-like putative cysteine protease
LRLLIHHRTTYRYRAPVSLGPHRLMLRPRESRDIRLISMSLAATPPGTFRWASDVFGNAVATAFFPEMTETLVIESRAEIEHSGEAWPVFDIAASATLYPFGYSPQERAALGPLMVPQFPDLNGRLATWARGFVHHYPTDTLSLLKDLNAGISAWIFYQSRDDEGTQAPLETLARGWGSCRDIAVLMIEAARSLGFGARIVSGYLYVPDSAGNFVTGSSGSGSTHAWVEIYVPGAGWITFDPTNRAVGNFHLVPVATAPDIDQVIPVSGSFTGFPSDFLGMNVEVAVTWVDGQPLSSL